MTVAQYKNKIYNLRKVSQGPKYLHSLHIGKFQHVITYILSKGNIKLKQKHIE